MGIETLLLESGIAFGVALLCAAVYKGVSAQPKQTGNLAQSVESPVDTPPTTSRAQSMEATPFAEPLAEFSQETPKAETPIVPMTSATLVEAPAPFEEPQTAFTKPEISSTPLPTDVSAVSNIANPVENASPALVIARPKRARRTRKASPDGTPRRRRVPKLTQPLPMADATETADTAVMSAQQEELPHP